MEIGAEISKKIRAAIKGKLQELGAYIDEELPDYIMVMVANKKTPQQMSDDLSLFLGNNTVKFTHWLHGVLEKLRTVAAEPTPVKNQPQLDNSAELVRSRSYTSDVSRAEESKVLAVSSSRSDRTDACVSSSAYENRKETLEKGSSRLTSAVKPLVDLLPSEAVIDIKPEMDDDLIADDVESGTSRTVGAASRPAADVYRAGQNKFTSIGSDGYRSAAQDGRSSRASKNGSKKEEFSRKRKAPVASSVVRVSQAADEDSDDLEEDESSYGGRGVSSRVSLPSKPERRPTLPPAKQANRNLILKAISEAQDSITKTTAYSALPKRQTVPVAPRTRLASREEMTAAIQLVQEHLNSFAPRAQAYTSPSLPSSRTHTADGDPKKIDTRSFIMSRPQLEGSPGPTQQQVQSALPRTVQPCKEKSDSSSPKFIVTLDGVPSPLENLADCDMDLDDVRPPSKVTEDSTISHRRAKVSVLDRLQDVSVEPEALTDDPVDVENEENSVPVKKQKVIERCKFWPVCKSGDECMYHHPTTQCKTFPNCKFGDKCLFVHPNCKYDARCRKPECPFTHVSRRSVAAPPPPRPAVKPAQTTSVCRFFPECKKMECSFYHPKPCRFAGQCKRAGCTFYHPSTAVPPRHALKWTKTQSS